MRSKLLAIGFALAVAPAFAQAQTDNYNKSVFSKFHEIPSAERLNNSHTAEKVQQHFPGMKVSVDRLSGNFTDIFGTATSLPGNTLEAKVQSCFTQSLSDFGIHANEWLQVRNYQAPHASFISYQQNLDGHKVIFSWLNFRFTKDGRLERLQMKNFGTPAANLLPTLSLNDAKQAAAQDISGVVIAENNIDNDWVWFPVPSSAGYTLRPAYSFNIKGTGKNLPVDLKGYIDAVTGAVLYRSNAVKETVTDTIKGNVYKHNPLLPATAEPLANLAVSVGPLSSFTDTFGVFSDITLVAPITATVKLQGKWSKVNAVTSSNITPSFPDTILINGGTFMFPVTTPSSDRHVNAYYHVNRVHDFMKLYYPTFTGMDISLPTNVDVTGTCNAFYNGNSINFYIAGGGCNSFALCGDIIYHEYGHGISDKFYNAQGVGSINNGALNEANSDIWGISITHDPVLGKGSTPAGGIIRRYDQLPKVYPQDIIGEVHADGEIIAGAWWDVAVNINSVDTMTQLFTSTYYDVPDGPDGTEGDVYHQVLISALLNDDNDANLSNGTPHFTQIVQAFAKHGIYLLGDATLTHTEVPNTTANTDVTINATVNVTTPAFMQDVKLFYRVRNSGLLWAPVVMTNTSGANYTAQIPGQSQGSIVDYYLAIFDNSQNLNASFPAGYLPSLSSIQTTIPYQFGIGFDNKGGTDFEAAATGWTIGNVAGDNATSGVWIQAKPIGSYITSAVGTLPVQPNADHTTNTTGNCLITGNASSTTSPIGTADVDGGKTTVITPVFDITGFTDPVIEYYRWYSNDRGSNPGQDYWQVMIKDSASANWVWYVDRTTKSDYAWRRRIFRVRDYLSAASTKIMMKFTAEDLNPGSTVEAGIDDFFLYDKGSLDVENVNAAKANIYPNPANNEIFVKLMQTAKGTIAVFDLTGKRVLTIALSGASEYSINTKDIAAGTYFLMIQTDKSVQSHKVVVIH